MADTDLRNVNRGYLGEKIRVRKAELNTNTTRNEFIQKPAENTTIIKFMGKKVDSSTKRIYSFSKAI